ncbi:MAG: 2-oxoglutarate dehydrogenase E1 component [Chitinophagaceae bacterium]|nr:2-oxoglutarate dehydrogenase E1 component [Chitinophagaceae bacterium]MCW5914000.1 2-oxoglutarate dehydrogenase E1 component [Chitinophagaceae bacterium]MCZ2395980.1 2-oxoglutarate dehydrogenase E1 component [Chitinophagales bacterium]
MKDFSFITASHPSYIENLYFDFKKDPESIDGELRKFFEGYDFAVSRNGTEEAGVASVSSESLIKEFGVYQLIQAYRKKGHLIAKTNPIRERKDRRANLSLDNFGLSESDLDSNFEIARIAGMPDTQLRKILEHLKKCYASSVGIEFDSVNDPKKIQWIINAAEKLMLRPVAMDQKKRILEKLNQGVMFEEFLQKKYIGQKRFSLEGGEGTIAALDAIISKGADLGVQEVAIGMAHRGRLNILANILGKTYEQIFTEFEGTAAVDSTMGSGDVKYHMGYSSEVVTPGGKAINLKLAPNPSHLEAVDPVVLGFSRSKADVIYNSDYDKILPILIHGDSSLAGQGIVYEVIQMSGLEGFGTGGTLHFVINNQIGFTTDFDDARTSDYCTSLAGAVQAPVFHVNGDDAEAVVKAAEIATLYRQEFNSDIFVDMVCYRKHGHNEGDDPKFTQPGLYGLIEKHPNPREQYVKFLVQTEGEETTVLAEEMEKKYWDDLQARLDEVKQNPLPYKYQKPEIWWQSLRRSNPEDFLSSPVTAVTEEELLHLFHAIMEIPEGFTPLRKIKKLLQDKEKLFETDRKFDWATAELLAYASIINEGKDVRMSGQDVRRGTFSHRHAVLRDEGNDKSYNRLSNIGPDQGKLRIWNSLLSEYAVLGFEYGYAMANPNNLVIWEAQFGDFANGAQTIIDQFVVCSEQKWGRMNGLVVLLPHGYEGQGPEHSSARIERFLQMCAEDNIVVTNVTTASNFFHVLRRQLAWPFRKPLINFSPKANLRLHDTYSSIDEFTSGAFKEVIDDTTADPDKTTKVILCSGKIYYDLHEKRKNDNIEGVALVRLEQLYPIPEQQLQALVAKYKKAVWIWVQEEPMNMGAASFLKMNLPHFNMGIIARPASAATASGYSRVHKEEQAEILNTAFSI